MKCFAGLAACAACIMLSLSAAGEGLSASSLPANTRWMLHLDARALLQSPLGQELLTSMAGTSSEAKLTAFEALTSIDVRHDLRSVTVCGAGNADQGGVLYLRGNWNLTKLTTIAAGAEAYSAQAYHRHTVMSWDDQKDGRPAKRQYACFASTNLALLSDHETSLTLALDVLDGRTPGLANAARLQLFEQPSGRPFLWLAAADVKDLVANNPQAAVLQQADSVTLHLAADAQGLQVTAGLKAATPEAAQQAQQVMQGFQSLALLQAGRNPDVAAIAQSTSIRADGRQVHVAMTLPLDLVRRLIARKRAAGAPALQPATAVQDPF